MSPMVQCYFSSCFFFFYKQEIACHPRSSTTKGKALHVIFLQESLWFPAGGKTWSGSLYSLFVSGGNSPHSNMFMFHNSSLSHKYPGYYLLVDAVG